MTQVVDRFSFLVFKKKDADVGTSVDTTTTPRTIQTRTDDANGRDGRRRRRTPTRTPTTGVRAIPTVGHGVRRRDDVRRVGAGNDPDVD